MTNETTIEPTAATLPVAVTLPDGHHLIVPVVIRPTYAIGYESWKQHIFLHLRLSDAVSGSDSEALSRDVDTCAEMLGQPLLALGIPNDDAFNSILHELGFVPAGQATNGADSETDVFVLDRRRNLSEASAH